MTDDPAELSDEGAKALFVQKLGELVQVYQEISITPRTSVESTFARDPELKLQDPVRQAVAVEYWVGEERNYREVLQDFRAVQQGQQDRLTFLAKWAARIGELQNLQKPNMLARIAQRLAEPARPFDPATDILEETREQRAALFETVEEAMKLVDDSRREFAHKASLLNLLRQLIDEGRIYYANHLPGDFRAQRMVSGKFRILIDRSLRWVFDGLDEYVKNNSPPEQREQTRQAILAYLAAKLLHEPAEVRMESEPRVRWERGDLDPAITDTEVVAYQVELAFLKSVSGFLEAFAPVVSEHSPLLGFYRDVLRDGQPADEAARRFVVETLGYRGAYDAAHVRQLHDHIDQQANVRLAELDERLPGHYVDRLYVLDRRPGPTEGKVVPLRYVRVDELTAEERQRAARSLLHFFCAAE
jgi:hypothetical protein